MGESRGKGQFNSHVRDLSIVIGPVRGKSRGVKIGHQGQLVEEGLGKMGR